MMESYSPRPLWAGSSLTSYPPFALRGHGAPQMLAGMASGYAIRPSGRAGSIPSSSAPDADHTRVAPGQDLRAG